MLLFLFPTVAIGQETTQDATTIKPFFYNAQRFNPSVIHQLIYVQMEECSGQQGNFSQVFWFHSPFIIRGPDHPMLLYTEEKYDLLMERRIYGLWWDNVTNGDTIQAILLDSEHVLNRRLIGHESLHSIYGGEIPLEVQERCLK